MRPGYVVALALLLALIFLGMAAKAASERGLLQSWEQGRAVIRSAEFPQDRVRAINSMHQLFTPEVAYDYEVAGRTFRGHRVQLVEGKVSRETMEEMRDKYRVGATVPVFYDPKDVGSSTLDRELPLEQLVTPALLGLCSLAVVVGLVLLGIKRARGR